MKLTQFLEGRGLCPELVKVKMGVTQIEKNGKAWAKIPYLHTGQIVNNKYRGLEKKIFAQDANAKKCFYNYDIILDPSLKNEPLIITEGEFDTWSAIQSGFVKTVSVPDGAPASKVDGDSVKYDYLMDDIATIRENCPYVILAVDGDSVGGNLLHDLSVRLGKDFCKWIKYPKDCKDLNDALIKYGIEGVRKSIATQEWIDIDGVFTLNELPPVAEATVYDINMQGFDNHFKLRLGDFSVVTGIPGMGKSTWVNDVMARVSMKHGLKVAFASFEQHPSLDHVRNLTKWYMGRHPRATGAEAREWINKSFCFIYPSDKQQLEERIDISWFLERASASIIQHNAQIIIIDPWNELEHSTRKGESLTEYVGRSIKKLKHFAKSNNVHLMVVAHPAKMYRNKDGTYPMPSLYDISDSAHWANKADLGIVVHRESYESTDTIIANKKSRYHEIIGYPAQVNFRFNRLANSFECSET